MILLGTALVLVTSPGHKPYTYEHIWMSGLWDYALWGLLEWKRVTEQEHECTLEILEWTLQELSDRG